MSEPTKFLLREDQIPMHWTNLMPDLPGEPLPPLSPRTGEPAGPEDLGAIFPTGLIEGNTCASNLRSNADLSPTNGQCRRALGARGLDAESAHEALDDLVLPRARHDAEARASKLSPDERWRWHQEHSGPVMDELRESSSAMRSA